MAAEQIKVINYVYVYNNDIDFVRFDTTVNTLFGLFHNLQIWGSTQALLFTNPETVRLGCSVTQICVNRRGFNHLLFVIKT